MSVRVMITALILVLTTGVVHAADLGKAKATVDRIRQPDPPSVSTSTKPSPVGIPTREFRPPAPSTKSAEPPSPVNRNNPQNDPSVQRGFDAHQKQHGR